MTCFEIAKMLHRWRLSYTRPTYTLKRVDYKKQQEFQEKFQELKTASEDMVFIYEDESHIRNDQALHVTWNLKMKHKQVPTYGYHATLSLFGALNAMNGEFLCIEAPKCHA
jgi:hypothetical protein